MLWSLDCALVEAAARLVADHADTQKVMVSLAETNFIKALPFAPYLLVAWHAKPSSRSNVLAILVSCALALVIVWCVTTSWQRPRPIAPTSECLVSRGIFASHFDGKPNYNRWGCFPSDHAAYMTALAMGLCTIHKRVGIACFIIGVMLNGAFRISTGLHYPTDLVAGLVIGLVAHLCIFSCIGLPTRIWVTKVAAALERSFILRLGLAVVVVEMSVLFHDIRFLDSLIFK